MAAAVLLGISTFNRISAAPKHGVSKRSAAISLEEARKVALKRVPGTVEDEFALEDDDGNAVSFVFVIKDSKEKTWEVQIGAAKGDIESVEEQESEDEDSEDPPPAEEPPVLFAGVLLT